MNVTDAIDWLTVTPAGLWTCFFTGSVVAILVIEYLKAFFHRLIRPHVEHTFYEIILNNYLGPFLSKHKIIATFIRLNGLGESVVDGIVMLIGTFFIVALLSSSLTALIFELRDFGFIYSFYLVWLVSMISMFFWVLIQNLRYFYKVVHRLK